MKLHLDNNNYVVGYTSFCLNYDKVDGIEYTGEIPSDFKNYKYVNGQLVLDEKKASVEKEMQELAYLREMRKSACFPYVNRGELWYGSLSVEQKEELGAWYQAWLDVTDTKVVPEAPKWLI